MPSAQFLKVKGKIISRDMGRSLREGFAPLRKSYTGIVLTSTQISVGGRIYPFRNESAVVYSPGDQIAVENVRRKASVLFVPKSGSSGATGSSSGGGSSLYELEDHVHSDTFSGSGGALLGYAAIYGTPVSGNIAAWVDGNTVEDAGVAVGSLTTIANTRKMISLRA